MYENRKFEKNFERPKNRNAQNRLTQWLRKSIEMVHKILKCTKKKNNLEIGNKIRKIKNLEILKRIRKIRNSEIRKRIRRLNKF